VQIWGQKTDKFINFLVKKHEKIVIF